MSEDDVNVDCSPETSTPETQGKRTYPIAFVADLGADGRLSGPTAVDKEEFAAVLARARPEIAISISDPPGGGDDWEFKLSFDAITAFRAEAMLTQVPGAQRRLDVRAKLTQRQSGQIAAAELDAAIAQAAGGDASLSWLNEALASPGAAPPPSVEPSGAGSGSSLLDMVDEPSDTDRVTADVERIAAAAGDSESKVSGAEGGRLSAAIKRLDEELTVIADRIVRHPDVRRLEQAWRGLKFLVDHIDFREGAQLSVLDITRDELVTSFVDKLVTPAFDGDIPTPGLVLIDFSFVNKPDDIATLDELAQHAAGLPVPLAVPLEAMFFNVKTVALIKNLPNLSGLTDGWQFAKWKSLRNQPYAKALVPVLGRFVLREPYDGSGRRGEFAYSETVSGPSRLLWGGGHLAVGVCAARSFANHGWPTRMFGAAAGKLEDLPVVPNPRDANAPFGPGDALLPDRKMTEFPGIGINLLQAVKGKDYCILMGGVSAARAKKTADGGEQEAVLEVSLPYQMFSNVISTYLWEMRPRLNGLDAEKIKDTVIFELRHLMGLAGTESEEAVTMNVAPHPDDATQIVVAVRLTPPPTIAPGGLHVEMGFTVTA